MLEPGNFHDKNAVAVEESLDICHGRHFFWKRFHVLALFLNTGTWNRSLHCDWKTVVGRQDYAKETDYLCNLPYHFSSIFRRTNFVDLIFVVACNHEN